MFDTLTMAVSRSGHGSPFGLEQIVTAGIVSALDWKIEL